MGADENDGVEMDSERVLLLVPNSEIIVETIVARATTLTVGVGSNMWSKG